VEVAVFQLFLTRMGKIYTSQEHYASHMPNLAPISEVVYMGATKNYSKFGQTWEFLACRDSTMH